MHWVGVTASCQAGRYANRCHRTYVLFTYIQHVPEDLLLIKCNDVACEASLGVIY